MTNPAEDSNTPTPPVEETPTTPTPPAETPAEAPAPEAPPAPSPTEEDTPEDPSQEALVSSLMDDEVTIEAEEFAEDTPAPVERPPEAAPVAPEAQPPAQPPVAAPVETPPTAPVAQPPTAPQQEPPAAPEAQPPVQPQPAPAEAPQPQPPAPTPLETLTPEQVEAQRNEWRANAETQLAETFYQLPEGVREQLVEEPEAVIPRLMSRVYLDTVEASTYAILSHLPQVIDMHLQSRETAQQLEGRFDAQWPQIDRNNAQVADTVNRLGTAYRQANPQASPDDFIRDVGAQTILALQIPPTSAPAPVTPEQTPQTVPHQPVGQGAPSSPAPTQPQNPFDALARQDEELDETLDLD